MVPTWDLLMRHLVPLLIFLMFNAWARVARTVAETLDAMKYHDAGAFVADVRLIFDNARRYNPPKHPIHVAACKLSKVRCRGCCSML